MGGFRPSPNFIPSNTQIGTLTSSNHQFTGSVDITGSLLINGVSISANGGGAGTPGGANTQIQFNNAGAFGASAAFTYDGTSLEVSGATAQAGLGLALAGYNGSRANAANFAHNAHMSDTAYALQQRHTGETILNAPSGQNVSVRINGSNALVVAGALGANVGINTGSPAARLHVSGTSGEKDVLRVDGDGQKEHSLYVQGTTGHVGIGTGTPLNRLTVVSTGSQARFSYDADSFATITVEDGGNTTIVANATIFSGAFGNTDFETRSVNFSILSPSGTSIVDTTGLGNNVTYIYSIEDGSFVGQQKKIFGKITYVYGQTTNSNALTITGSNIEGTNFGSGAVCFLSNSAGYGGMSLVWGGSKWLCVGTNNFQLQ